MLRPPRSNSRSVSHRRARAPKTEGWEKKNGSIQPKRDATSQLPIHATSKMTWSSLTRVRFSAGIGRHHFFFEVAPNRFVEFSESGKEPHLLHVPRARQANGVIPFQR